MDNNSAHRENIRKLAKDDEIKGGLKSLQDREPIPGKITEFTGNAFATDSNAGAGVDGGIDPEDPNSMAEPDPSDPNNPNNSANDGNHDPNKDGPQDADDLLDDTAGPTLPDGSGDPYSGGSLPKITGLEDCETGQCVTMHLDGRFPAPDGWGGPDSPPPVPGYIAGEFWRCNHDVVEFWDVTPHPVIDAAFNAGPFSATHEMYSQGANVKRYWDKITHGNYQFYFAYKFVCPNTSIPAQFCASDYSPLADEWPVDGCYDVAMIDGKVTTNPYDSEAPASAKEEKSAAKFCTTGGNEVVIRAAADGKTMMYPVTTGGAPTGQVKTYNSDGTLSGIGDASQQNIDSQLPR